MRLNHSFRKRAVTAFLSALVAVALGAAIPGKALAQGGPDPAELDRLFAELAKPEQPGWEQIEDAIAREFSKSGSAAMDLLLQRGREALSDSDYDTAIEHLSALIDHAPGFAEGWNTRATAWFRAGRYGLALQDISQALTLEPRHFGALIGLATILREVNREDLALEALRRAQKIHPHRPNVIEGIETLSSDIEGDML